MLADQGVDLSALGSIDSSIDVSSQALSLGEVKILLNGKGSQQIEDIFREVESRAAFYQRIQKELRNQDAKVRFEWTKGEQSSREHDKRGFSLDTPIRVKIRKLEQEMSNLGYSRGLVE